MLSLEIKGSKRMPDEELVAKGPKYRELNGVNWKATETMFLESIDLYAKRLLQKRTSGSQISL